MVQKTFEDFEIELLKEIIDEHLYRIYEGTEFREDEENHIRKCKNIYDKL